MIAWLKQKLVNAFAPKYVNALIRTLLTALGTWLVSNGAPADVVNASLTQLIEPLSGLILVAAASVLSFADKAKNQPIEVPKDQKIVAITTVPKTAPASVGVESPLAQVTELPPAKR